MNQLYIISSMSTGGGIERVLSINTNESIRQGNKVTIISFDEGAPYYQYNSNIVVKTLKRKSILFQLIEMRRIVSDEYFDNIIVMNMTKLSYIVAPALFKVLKGSLITSEHISFHTGCISDFTRIMMYKLYDAVVFLTNHDYEKYGKYFSYPAVIRNPAHNDFVENRLPRLYKKKSVISVGHLNKRKGHARLIQIWNNLPLSVKEGWQLKIIGSGPMRNQLDTMINDYNLSDEIILIDDSSNIIDYYNTSSIFAMTSHEEGFPMVLIEAMSLGLNLISYDCETGPSEIIPSKTKLIINDDDSDCYIKRLSELMKDESLREELSQLFIKKSNEYRSEKIYGNWVSLFNRLLK